MLDEKDRRMKTSLFYLTDFNWQYSFFKCAPPLPPMLRYDNYGERTRANR